MRNSLETAVLLPQIEAEINQLLNVEPTVGNYKKIQDAIQSLRIKLTDAYCCIQKEVSDNIDTLLDRITDNLVMLKSISEKITSHESGRKSHRKFSNQK